MKKITSIIPGRQTSSTSLKSKMPLNDCILNPASVSRVVAYIRSPKFLETIFDVVHNKLSGVDFQAFQSSVQVASLERTDIPTVLFVDDITLRDINEDRIKAKNENTVIVLLSNKEVVCSMPPSHSSVHVPHVLQADLIAAMVGTENINPEDTIASFIRLSEDKLNIEKHSKARRFIVLVVDDEPRWFAEFLPKLYSIIGRRADIMLKRTYEAAVEFLNEHGDKVVCMITDMCFPKEGKMDKTAGVYLISLAHENFPWIAKIVATQFDLESALNLESYALYLQKGEPDSIKQMEKHMHNWAGFGNFIIQINGEMIAYRSIWGLKEAIELADFGILENSAERDFFSTWLYMHGYYTAGDKIRPNKLKGQPLRESLLDAINEEIDSIIREPFIIDKKGDINRVTTSIRRIRKELEKVSDEALESWAETDYLSFWLMRHGFPELADELRPIQGEIVEVRKQAIEIFDKWIENYKDPKYKKRGLNVEVLD